MAKKKLLTIDDLVLFCQQNNFARFSSEESGYSLAVQVPAVFEIEDGADENHVGMMRLKFRIFHTGLNRNKSYVSEEAAKKAMKTISDRPVLAAIHQLDDGEWDFEGHEMEIVENSDGEYEISYIEKQIGSFSSEEPFWEHDDKLGKDYVCAYAYISEGYTKAADIIRRKGYTKNSCELSINEMSYNAKENYLSLDDFYLSASTLLGSRADGTEIQEGMLGSRADIADFSTENNAVHFESGDELTSVNQENLDDNTNSIRKEDGSMIDEEKIVVEEESAVTTDAEFEVDDADADDGVDVLTDDAVDGEEEDDEHHAADDDVEIKKVNTYSNGVSEYSISMSDKLYAISTLVNDTYSELDNDYYFVDVYDDEKYLVMYGWTNAYRQSYKVRNNQYSLIGDRVQVYSQWLSADEIKELENIRSNYEATCEKLAKYEAEPRKIEVLESEDFALISEDAEFIKLREVENHFDLTVEEVEAKANEILLHAAKSGAIVTAKEEKSTGRKQLPIYNKKTSRYGNLFSR